MIDLSDTYYIGNAAFFICIIGLYKGLKKVKTCEAFLGKNNFYITFATVSGICFRDRNRGVAQLASALAWGARGRLFESDHPDSKKNASDENQKHFFSSPLTQLHWSGSHTEKGVRLSMEQGARSKGRRKGVSTNEVS